MKRWPWMTKWKLNKFTMNEDVYIEERPAAGPRRSDRGPFMKK